MPGVFQVDTLRTIEFLVSVAIHNELFVVLAAEHGLRGCWLRVMGFAVVVRPVAFVRGALADLVCCAWRSHA